MTTAIVPMADDVLTLALARFESTQQQARRFLGDVGADLPVEITKVALIAAQGGPLALQGITAAAKEGAHLLARHDEVLTAVVDAMAAQPVATPSASHGVTLAELDERRTREQQAALVRELVESAEAATHDLVAAVARRVQACRVVHRRERVRIVTEQVTAIRAQFAKLGQFLQDDGDLGTLVARLEQRLGTTLPGPAITWTPPPIPDPTLREAEEEGDR